MSRIDNYYQTRFRSLLGQLGARRIECGVRWLFDAAARRSREDQIQPPLALARICLRLAKPLRRREPVPERFLCDAGLGGLTRWLRVAGYEARWQPDLDDAALIAKALQLRLTLLTTDSLMMERGVLRDGIVPSLWLPPTATVHEQMELVLGELNLNPRDPRCMSCGGELQVVEKEAVAERIPPRTYRWLDEYFVCSGCGRLFWRGSHWNRIARSLERLRRSDCDSA